MSTIKRGKQPLLITNPNLAEEWDYEKNAPLTPNDVTAGTNKKVWWICQRNHSFQAIVASRTRRNDGCPYCSGRKVLLGFNDLNTLKPELSKEWNYIKNADLSPSDVTVSSGRKVWWKCSACGNEWEAKIYHRTKGHGCPFCSGRNAIPGKNDFATLNPQMAKEWNYERNGVLNPSDFTVRSGQKAWWKCLKGHEWQATIHNRSGGHGCPYCAGLKAIVGYNDLLTINPDFISEWDYDKNRGLSPSDYTLGSGKKVWWKCLKGHEWKTAICDRSRGSGCPRCQYIGTSKPEQGIAYYLSQCCITETRSVINHQEIDVYLPEYRIGIEYDGRYYHSGRQKKEEKKNQELTDVGIVLYRVKESDHNAVSGNTIFYDTDYMGPNYSWAIKTLFRLIADLTKQLDIGLIDVNTERDDLKIRERYALIQKENSLASKCPEVAQEWDYGKNGILTPEMFSPGCDDKVWWICNKGHEWKARINSRVYGNGCPFCAGQRAIPGENDFATLKPDLLKEWHYERNGSFNPSDFTVSSGTRVWWKCAKGHEWQGTIHGRSAGHGCPVCAGKKVLKGFNDLQTSEPELSEEWNYDKNGDLKPTDFTVSSGKKVWWRCSKGHEWEAIIANRSGKGRGCPYCSGKRVLVGINDLSTVFPELAKEWNYEKNKDLKPSDFSVGSGKKVWWKCAEGHEWESIIVNRTQHGRGCPFCAGQKVIPGVNDLQSVNPELAKEWNHDKNGDLKPTDVMAGSGKIVWWKCAIGHEWKTSVNTRSGGRGCPVCAQNKSKSIICVETGTVYKSIADARRKTGVHNISRCCIDGTKTAGGYHWKYV